MKPSILVVEDEAIIADDLEQTLTRLGYHVLDTVATGQAALSALEGARPSLVLMDIKLRGVMDGIETATKLRELHDVPVVYLTSHSDDATLGRASRTGPYGYILKPFSERDLRTAVEVALQKHRLEAKQARSERLASIGTMTAGVAHELNNPLAYTVGNLEFARTIAAKLKGRFERALGEGGPLELQALLVEAGELEEVLGDAGRGAERVRRIVRDLRRFARSEDAHRAVLSLKRVVDVALTGAHASVQARARLVRHDDAAPSVEADEAQLVQVVSSLLSNAVEAIPEGQPQRHEVRVATFTDDHGRAVIEVRDTGCGIAPATMDRIFDPFFTTKAVGQGMGLALTVCHSVVEAHGGELTAESEEGVGSVFRVILPPARRALHTLPPPMPASVRPPPPAGPATPARCRVLVVDDEAAVARSIARLLRDAHEVTLENDPVEALVKLTSGARFDVIFCDMMMPGMTGMELFRALEAKEPELARRVVFLTGGSDHPAVQEFFSSVPNLALVKPFSADTLRSIVADLGAREAAGP